MAENDTITRSLHEAAHAVAARRLGIQVLAASASNVRTRYRDTPQAAEHLALVDLAGGEAEIQHLRRTAWLVDEQQASERVLRLVHRRLGLGAGAPVTAAHRREASALFYEFCGKASDLVKQNWAAIERVAAELADGKVLTGADIDALMAPAAETPIAPTTELDPEVNA
jgi:hypothetical protein